MIRRFCVVSLILAWCGGGAVAQGIFLARGQTAVLVEANAGFTEDGYGIGLALGVSAGSYVDIGFGMIHVGGSGGEGKIGFTQFLSLNLLRQANKAGTVFSLSVVETVTAEPRGDYSSWAFGGTSGPDYSVYVGGRAVWQTNPTGNRRAPFVGLGRQGIASADGGSYSVFELGISLVRPGRSGNFVISPSVGFGGGVTAYAVSLTFSLFSGGEASKRLENTNWGD